jgi:hypothetical protein
MWSAIFVVIGIYVGVRILTSILPDPLQRQNQSDDCEIHKWTYKNLGEEDEYMVCINCKKLPNGDQEVTE